MPQATKGKRWEVLVGPRQTILFLIKNTYQSYFVPNNTFNKSEKFYSSK